jgi:hypothetical protein
MVSDERPMEHGQVDQQEAWAAIRYLDPDERDQDRKAKSFNDSRRIGPTA